MLFRSVKKVESVPVRTSDTGTIDDNYLRTGPGMYPDLLIENEENSFFVRGKEWQSFWIDVETEEDAPVGKHEITLRFTTGETLLVCYASKKYNKTQLKLQRPYPNFNYLNLS